MQRARSGADDVRLREEQAVEGILAFANAWKGSSDAHIVIGVEDGKGRRATITGLGPNGHLDDASLQQFVNSKTNQKVDFNYIGTVVDGEEVAVTSRGARSLRCGSMETARRERGAPVRVVVRRSALA